ncbi:MAG: RluA family pseudouridine synthase [Candidatus Cryptobacteroides sp.]
MRTEGRLFNSPFRYNPSPEVVKASWRLISDIRSDESLRSLFRERKMLGVLVVSGEGSAEEVSDVEISAVEVSDAEVSDADADPVVRVLDDGTRFLAAFSGLAAGRNRVKGFVPPIFDLLDPQGHFKKEEAEISGINRRLEDTALDSCEVKELKDLRKEKSDSLQKWLFSNYIVSDGAGTEKPIGEIFADLGLVPPAGTGDCAAPKLLNYAFTHGLKPLSMGEFFYEEGCGPRFEPSCSGKCGPLLRWMLRNTPTENPYGFDDGTIPETIWEDEWMMVLSKPAGMLCVPGKDGQKSLLERLPAEVFSVHRLDMDTSGILLAAKTPRSQKELQRQFENRQVEKTYIALLENRNGLGKGDEGTIDLPLIPDINDRPRQMVSRTFGKEAVTEYEVLDVFPAAGTDKGDLALVRFRPRTGRTHQLRVHSAQGLGCPILGDLLYGASYHRRLCLHAESISLRHPVTGALLTFRIPFSRALFY